MLIIRHININLRHSGGQCVWCNGGDFQNYVVKIVKISDLGIRLLLSKYGIGIGGEEYFQFP
jgi:hypothetical protein